MKYVISNEDTEVIERPGAIVLDEAEAKAAQPKMFHVIIHNDNVTPFELVAHILMSIFNKDSGEALEITMAIHFGSKAVVGTYVHEIAEQKQEESMSVSTKYGYPLTVSIEEDE